MDMVKIKIRAELPKKGSDIYEEEVVVQSTYLACQDLVISAMNKLTGEPGYRVLGIYPIPRLSGNPCRGVTIAKDELLSTVKVMIVEFEFTFISPEEILNDSFNNWIKHY